MSTTIPYTWTQGRQVLAWGSPVPSPGQWYPHVNDPAWVNAVTAVYIAVPFWLALDFGYTKDRNLLVMMSAPTDDGQRGRLRVYRGTTTEPATLTDYSDLEVNDTSGAAMGVRGSGEVDVFYLHGGTLKHRLSEDAAETWKASTSHALTGAGGVAFTPKESAQPGSAPTGFFAEAQSLGGYVQFCYLAAGSIALILHGRLTGAVDGDQPHIVKADWDETAGAWQFHTVAKLTGVAAVIPQMFPLRSGDILLSNGIKIRNLTNAGTYTLNYTIAMVTAARLSGLDETLNQFLACFGVGDGGADSDGSGPYYSRRLVALALNPAQTAWAATGSAANTSAEKFKSWRAQYIRANPDSNFGSRAGIIRLRFDRRWELLFLNRNQQPEILRFHRVTSAVTPLTWY